MTIQLGISLAPLATRLPNPPPFSSIAANGWQTTVASPTDLSLSAFTVQREGFDATGTAATIEDTLYLTKRVRQLYPNQASFTTDQVAVSEPICAADVIAGATNNSTLVSPTPICHWTMPHRLLTNSTVHWSISAFHWAARDGKPVACVRVRANDGATQTAWQTVTAPTIDTQIEDANPTALYNGDLDITGLADGAFWLEAEVYPWVGTSASVAKSEDLHTASANVREFTRRYYRKGPVPAWVAVASTGNDTTGAASAINEATALITPCLTVGGALKKLRDLLGTATAALDGARIVIVDAVTMGPGTFDNYQQDIAGVYITRASSSASRAAAQITMAANFRPYLDSSTINNNEGALILEDVSILISGANRSFDGELSQHLDVQLVNVDIDLASNATLLRSSDANINYFGVTFTNYPTGTGFHPLELNGALGARDIRIVRGVTASLDGENYEAFITIGCEFTNPGSSDIKEHSDDHVWYNNRFLDTGGTVVQFRPGSGFNGLTVGRPAVAQNVVEWTSVTSNPAITISGTSDYGDIPHGVVHHNTVAGVENHGRLNLFYDETTGSERNHAFVSVKGNLAPQLNVKGDVFRSDAAFDGNQAFIHGNACAGNFTRDIDAGGGSFAQAYPGIDCTIDGGDALFTNNQAVSGTTASPVAGAGGGNYTLQVSSPARDLFSQRLLSHDVAGSARPASGTIDAGAYA